MHLALGKGLRRAAARAGAIGAQAVQVFVDNPTAWKRRGAPPKHLDLFREQMVELHVTPVAVHASYLVNLAGPDPDFRRRSIDVLASDMAVAGGYGASLVNVHTGSHRDTSVSEGIERVAEAVAAVLERHGGGAPGHQGVPSGDGDAAEPVLVLENAAGGGASIGSSIEEHARIAELAAALGVPEARLAFCLDTAHAWGAGYAMDDPDGIDAWLAEFDRELGLERLALIHLNDSRSERGSRSDRHEHVGAGRIGPRGFRHLLTHPLVQEKPFILETPGMDDGYDLINLERARALIAGEDLPALPPEAFLFKRRSAASAPADDDLDLARKRR
ncbi:MAG TPA: deoxyribonuclease IV [Candidatus Limnocylindrales bacterium]|nr:deoxyribonuclease IV [Candidatus Limnocylindrales bacterium]